MKKISITIIFAILMCTIPFSACDFVDETPTGTDASVESTVVPTETIPTTTPTPTKVPLGNVVTLSVPATYAALYDGIKVYTDATRSTVLTVLVLGDQITITGTCDGYGVTAEGSYVNLILMAVVTVTTPTPTAAPTDAPVPTTAPTEPTAIPTPKPTGTPTPTPTPKPTPTPTPVPGPTTAPVATLSVSEVESLVWTQVESARSVSGFTTNHSDVLSTRCRKSAERYVINHCILNGSCESCGAICQLSNGGWRWGTNNDFATLEECVASLGNYLVTQHVPAMATTEEYTEFGVGVAKFEQTGYITEYYVYISCASPHALQQQIDMGWYD